MKTSIGTALLGAAMMLCASQSAAFGGEAAGAPNKVQTAGDDVSARRHYRPDRYAYRPAHPYPMYYGRPVYYVPAPFLPIPPLWGYGWEWW